MAGKIIADQIQSTTAGTLDTKYVVDGSVKSYVNFNQGTGNVIRKSLNISSVTDRATGRASGNFTSSFSDAEHTATAMPLYPTSGTAEYWSCISNDSGNGGVDTSKTSWNQTYGDQNEEHFWDSNKQMIMVVGDLA